jgi:hypothetical protein
MSRAADIPVGSKIDDITAIQDGNHHRFLVPVDAKILTEAVGHLH